MSETTGQPQQPSTASLEEPALFHLHLELVIEVLSHLSYTELHSSGGSDKALDVILFRRPPPPTLEPGEDLDLYPILHAIDGVLYQPLVVPIRKWSHDGEDELNALDYPDKEDFASQPACTTMHVFFEHPLGFTVERSSGVRVKDLLEKMSEYWTGVPVEKSEEAKQSGRPIWRDYHGANDWLGDHNGWTGWEPCFVRDDGKSAQLTTFPLDS
ncbi:hypothetical protein JCM10213_009035 [Rhodosporidiobolus nylandii]